ARPQRLGGRIRARSRASPRLDARVLRGEVEGRPALRRSARDGHAGEGSSRASRGRCVVRRPSGDARLACPLRRRRRSRPADRVRSGGVLAARRWTLDVELCTVAATQTEMYASLDEATVDRALSWSERELPERVRTKHVHRLHPYLGKYVPQLV